MNRPSTQGSSQSQIKSEYTRHGSHFSGLTKFPDFSNIFSNFPVKTWSSVAHNAKFI